MQAVGRHQRGKENLDIHLLKPMHQRIDHPDPNQPAYAEYCYRKSHPALQWLPTKLAEWVAANLREELGFADKAGDAWTVDELNQIICNHLVSDKTGGSIRTFGCVEWESESYRGISRSRCYPFDLEGHRFHSLNPKVTQFFDIHK